ncbi:hypothetical protein VZC37_19730 [Gordonia sp. LSe1-13]|uniref:Secreted protein n=1 Tax=Gordonia sesuvii TaxID=3116777 RepID=A0ABU7MHI8_9ACTN|nr:hypothetical protein [Gordonia sp. LSe1-13]
MAGRGSRNRMRIVAGAIAFSAVTAAGIGAAGPADAALQGIAIDTPAGYGSSASGSMNYNIYGAGCAYKLDVIVHSPRKSKSNLKVTSTINGQTTTIYNAKPTGIAVRPVWRPTTPGRTVLTATLDGVTKKRTVMVGTGVQLPDFIRAGACFVFPIY